MTTRFDEIREAHPDIGFGLYAYAPSGGVTLEVMTSDGKIYTFVGDTEQSVLDQAFEPDQIQAEPEPAPVEPTPSVFD